MPISAILVGGRRATVVPLVHEARDWEHGVFLGAIMSSETTAAQAGEVGKLRFDPMAMLPFCGYHMGDYFGHWLRTAKHDGAKMPRVFYVNWFRKDEDGKFMWPGFGENSRVLAWVFERVAGRAQAVETPIGLVPPVGDGGIDTSGLDVGDETMRRLLEVDTDGWLAQLPQVQGSTSPSSARSCRASCMSSCTGSSRACGPAEELVNNAVVTAPDRAVAPCSGA